MVAMLRSWADAPFSSAWEIDGVLLADERMLGDVAHVGQRPDPHPAILSSPRPRPGPAPVPPGW